MRENKIFKEEVVEAIKEMRIGTVEVESWFIVLKYL